MSEPTSHILLVEDEEAHAELIQRAFDFADNSYRLTFAGNLRQARKTLDEGPPDLIIADLQLPDGRGIDLLPPEDEPQAFPLVVLTAHGDEQVAVEAMKAGALDYVVKSSDILWEVPRVAERALREWRHITERKRAEDERSKLELRLQHSQRLESLGILAGGIAHDFNNLIMAIMGHAQLALADLESPVAVEECIHDIEAAAVHASELCRQLLTYSGRNRFVVEAIDLNQLVSGMIQLLEAAISKLAMLRLELASDIPAVEGAATQIRQIVMNLIMNASDALGGSKGEIIARTGVLDADAAYLEDAYLNDNLAPGRYVYVEVSDTGCGMDEATQKRLFDPFFTTKTSGRGLGMSAVKGILRSHQGALKLATQIGQGTTFRILFPASDVPLPAALPAERPTAGEELAAPRGAGGVATILVVDDDITIRAVTTITLEGAGYLVITAEDGRQAVEKYRQHRDEIAAVLLDISMPELSGDEAYRELRELGARIPIIVSSGSPEDEARKLIPDLSGFVQKPYKAEHLISQMRAVLHAPATSEASAAAKDDSRLPIESPG